MGGPSSRGPGMAGGPDLMRRLQGGPGQMGGSEMMSAPWGGTEQMGGPRHGRPGQMGGGPAMAMLDAIAQLDLTSEQRKKLDALKTDLQQRQQDLLGKIAEASEKLREVSRQQSLATRNLSDLRGHMTMANMDTANRAEEMLTLEQRQTLMRQGAHTMTPEQIRSAK